MKNSKLIIPEGSDSANYLGVNLSNVEIKIKDSNDLPKLITSFKEKLKIIDNKTVFNTKPFNPENFDYVPFSKVEIVGLYLNAYFYINKIKEELCSITRLKMTICSPKIESKVFLLRKSIWQNNYNLIVSANPSLKFAITGGEIQTNLAKLISIKFFTKSNFDEKSQFIQDKCAKWDSIDFSFDISKGFIGLDIFKIPETFSNQSTTVIDVALPGKYSEIEFDYDN